MARLLQWPDGVLLTKMQPLSGPRTVGATSNESITGYIQTVASAFGLWKWQFTIPLVRDRSLRRLRGLITALHGGANAVRFTFEDPDRSSQESGLAASPDRQFWSNGKPWSNGQQWRVAPPNVAVAAAAAAGDSIVTLADEHWMSDLDVGDWLGFFPFHFGLYVVTEVVASGQFRVWPPLAQPIDTGSFATLRPVMVLRLQGEDGAIWSRDPEGASDASLTLVQVEDADVRDYFADLPEVTFTVQPGGDLLYSGGGQILLRDGRHLILRS
jgi:hypothetical protein